MILHNGKIIRVNYYSQYDRVYDYVEPNYYCGLAAYNSSTSDNVWKITKILVLTDGTSVVTVANNASWDNRYNENYV